MLVVAGCDRPSKAPVAASRPANEISASRLELSLKAYRAGISRVPEADKHAVERIDRILELLHNDSSVLKNGRLFAALVQDDTTISGADLCRISGVARIGTVEEADLLDSRGRIVDMCRNPVAAWGARDAQNMLADFAVVFYVAPSVFDSASEPVSPEVQRGAIENYPVVRLPHGTNITTLRVRVHFSDGRSLDSIPIWKALGRRTTDSRAQ